MVSNVLAGGGDRVFPLYIAVDGQIYAGESLMNVRAFKDGGYRSCAKAIVARGGFFILNSRGKPKKFQSTDVAVNCCHGGLGEGGGICGLFEANGIPLASAGIFESSAFIDKYYTKLVLNALKINSAPWVYLRSRNQAEQCKQLGAKLVGFDLVILVGDTLIKPVKAGYLENGGDSEKLKVVNSLFSAQEALKDFVATGDTVLFLNDLPDFY